MPFGENGSRGVNKKKFRSTKPGKHEGFIPNPIGCNELLGRAVQEHARAASWTRQRQLPQLDGRGSPEANLLGADGGCGIEQQHSAVEAKCLHLETGPVKVHSVPPASEPRSC